MTLGVHLPARSIGTSQDRIEGPLTVTGAARYAYEWPDERVTYVCPVQSTIARGRVAALEGSAARALPGVITVLSHENVTRLHSVVSALTGQVNHDLAVLQSDAVAYRGQIVAAR
jgi:xanthine dehydrogenase YagR molybdenum-binding subunit